MKNEGRFWEIPLDTYPRMEQGGTIMRRASNVEASRMFRSALLSDEGRAVLKQYGFFLPGE